MVAAVRQGASISEVAHRFSVSRTKVRRWVRRAQGQRLDRVEFRDRTSGRHPAINRTTQDWEERILGMRRDLRTHSALGEFGAEAIYRALHEQGLQGTPSVRTIGRILERCGVLDGRRRIRRGAPPPGWYLPDVAKQLTELDSFDVVEGLVIQGALDVTVLTAISLHGGLAQAWPRQKITAKAVTSALLEHWQHVGLPGYAQFDNDTVFQGPHQYRDTLGRVIRLCLSLNVVPVFAPPRETGFQAAIEHFNGYWQAKVWQRFHFNSRGHLQQQSARFIAALHKRRAVRIDNAPPRTPIPEHWHLDFQKLTAGRIIYLRRTNDAGAVSLLGHRFHVDRNWPHRLVRAEIDLAENRIAFYALRRRNPNWQPLLTTIEHRIPERPFKE